MKKERRKRREVTPALHTTEGFDFDTESVSSNHTGTTRPSPCAEEAPAGPGEAPISPSSPSYTPPDKATDPPANTILGPPSGALASAIAQAILQPTPAEAVHPADHKSEQTQKANEGAHTEATTHIDAKATISTDAHLGITGPFYQPTPRSARLQRRYETVFVR